MSQRLLFRPLGMTSTSSRFADYEARTNRADGHVRENGAWVPRFTRDADAQSPAGGVSSSAVDMAAWMRMELAQGAYNGTPVVDSAALNLAQTAHMTTSVGAPSSFRPGSYGYGMNVGTDGTGRVRLSHSGAFALGAGTSFALLPVENLGIVALGNGQAIGVPEALTLEFMDLVETGAVQRDWLSVVTPSFEDLYVNNSRLAGKTRPTDPKPALNRRAYVGTYDNDYYGPARVRIRSGRLVLELGPDPMRFRLTHWSGNTFSYLPRGENATGIAAVTFHKQKGRVTRVNVENLEADLNNFRR
jgi:CubicO group peptidase (beta-lactamase class C family)